MCGHEYIKGIKACHAYFDEIDDLRGLFFFLTKRFPPTITHFLNKGIQRHYLILLSSFKKA